MTRLARLVIPGMPYHVTQRGNRRGTTFFEEEDFRVYRELLAEAARAAGASVWAYCLMPNHVHLIVVPERSRRAARHLRQRASPLCAFHQCAEPLDRPPVAGPVWRGSDGRNASRSRGALCRPEPGPRAAVRPRRGMALVEHVRASCRPRRRAGRGRAAARTRGRFRRLPRNGRGSAGDTRLADGGNDRAATRECGLARGA